MMADDGRCWSILESRFLQRGINSLLNEADVRFGSISAIR